MKELVVNDVQPERFVMDLKKKRVVPCGATLYSPSQTLIAALLSDLKIERGRSGSDL